MNCPACNRNLASTLSVCPSCGAMVGDSVREELALKISPMAKTANVEKAKAEIISKAEITKAELRLNVYGSIKPELPVKLEPSITEKPAPKVEPTPVAISNQPVVSSTPVVKSEPLPPAVAPPQTPAVPQMLSIATTRPHTSEFVTKPTSPTLVEFQNKNAVLPEWRLQLQNSVRRRNGNGGGQPENVTANAAATPTRQTVLVTTGATALKAEPIEQPVATAPAPPASSSNPMLEKALRRIEQSRQKYSAEEESKPANLHAVQNQHPRSFPYVVANRPQEVPPKSPEAPAVTNSAPVVAPRQFTPLAEIKAEKFDTNKLPPIPAKISSSFEKRQTEISLKEAEETQIKSFRMEAVETADVVAYEEPQTEEHVEEIDDDRAPISLRFNAALFDLIIGSFLSVVLLAPFMMTSGNLFTLQGLFAFLATCSIVMFIYLTTTIGTMGRTFGMRLFSLELVDIEENAYPTFHQAAVNSSVYLVSLALGGVGFLTLFLNHEKRAAHDLLSGTIVVKEYE